MEIKANKLLLSISRFAESQTRPKSFIKLPHRSEG